MTICRHFHVQFPGRFLVFWFIFLWSGLPSVQLTTRLHWCQSSDKPLSGQYHWHFYATTTLNEFDYSEIEQSFASQLNYNYRNSYKNGDSIQRKAINSNKNTANIMKSYTDDQHEIKALNEGFFDTLNLISILVSGLISKQNRFGTKYQNWHKIFIVHESVYHYNDVSWAWCLGLLTIWLFVQQFIQIKNHENTKDMYYWWIALPKGQ